MPWKSRNLCNRLEALRRESTAFSGADQPDEAVCQRLLDTIPLNEWLKVYELLKNQESCCRDQREGETAFAREMRKKLQTLQAEEEAELREMPGRQGQRGAMQVAQQISDASTGNAGQAGQAYLQAPVQELEEVTSAAGLPSELLQPIQEGVNRSEEAEGN